MNRYSEEYSNGIGKCGNQKPGLVKIKKLITYVIAKCISYQNFKAIDTKTPSVYKSCKIYLFVLKYTILILKRLLEL